jgi:hypothetical protein
MAHRDQHDRNHALKAPDLQVDDDDTGRGAEAPVRRKRRSRLGALLRLLLVLIVLVVVAAGALLGALRFGLVDPALLGLPSHLLGSVDGSGSATPNRPPEAEPDVIFAGDAAALTAAPGNTVAADPKAAVAWLRSSVKSASAAGATDGVSIAVPAELLPRIEGRRVRVTVSAKSGAEGDPVPFAVAYTAGAKGSSGWIVFVPEKDFTEHSLTFVVPISAMEGGEPHRIAIWADIEGRNVPLAVRSITIQPD